MEYVKLEISEQTYGKKQLLLSQMEILDIIKRYKEYQKLRKLELKIKSVLKKKVAEIKEETKKLEATLPKVKNIYADHESVKEYPKKRKALEDEIDEIKRKLAELQ